MGTKYICPQCETEVVLVNSGGVWRDIICSECNLEMKYEDDVKTEWVAHKDEHGGDYRIVEQNS